MVDMTMAMAGGGADRAPRFRKTRRYLAVGWIVVLSVFGGLVAWSIFAPFEGAILTTGQVSVESNRQAVQHLEGGIVREIFVEEGDEVEKGQVLLSLDPTVATAGVDAIEARFMELLGAEARLKAQRSASSRLALRPAYDDLADTDQMKVILQEQKDLLTAQRTTLNSQVSILRQRMEQFEVRISGMREEISAINAQEVLLKDEIERYDSLSTTSPNGSVQTLPLKRRVSELEGQKQSLTASIASTRVEISETETEISRLRQAAREEALSQLREVQTQIGELAEQRVTAIDRQDRLDIIAPRAGRVLGIKAHTIGGVIQPSEPIMHVVPKNDQLIAKVRVLPMDIDKVTLNQQVVLRFTAFAMDETPDVDGKILHISSDTLIDDATGMTYYEAFVQIPEDHGLPEKFQLLPGMPVDAMIQTESRSVLSYLVKPLTDSVARTFRE